MDKILLTEVIKFGTLSTNELSQLVGSWVQGFGFRVKLYWAFWVPRLQIDWEPWRDGRMRSHSHRSSGRAGRPENGRHVLKLWPQC
eukprot:s4240_g6.t1